jgi:quercetin dioxygenase-like cupin family protein/DNA-binding XRE family transcriptional regulator
LLSKTLTEGLEHYEIGPKVRALRLKKKLGLAQLSAHTGLSPAMLSKIERGHVFPTLPTLLRIALVFGVGLDYFFMGHKDRAVVVVIRKADRLRLPDQPGRNPPCYLFESLDFRVTDRKTEVYYAEFPLNSRASEPHQHPGTELVYVIAGRLVVNVDGQDIRLERGDVATFESGVPHSYKREGRSECKVIVVTVPQGSGRHVPFS